MKRNANYKTATNAAYELLARCPFFSLSTNVFYIIEKMLPDCKLLTYGQVRFLYGYSMEALIEGSDYGFSIVHGRKRIIFYNENAPLGCIRFTLAHEIGHYILGHVDENNIFCEREANCFARNLLCPVQVVDEFQLTTVDEYVSVFDITARMAEVSIERVNHDRYYISEENRSIISAMIEAHMMGFENLREYREYLVS